MRLSHRATAIGAAVLACAVLGGCTPGDKPGNSTAAATDTRIPAFTYGLEAMPGTLDVANNYNSADMAVMALVTQPLEIPNLDGSYTPVLAEKVSTPNPTTLVYDLRKDVTFSDGRPLTSEDVVFTIAHLRGAQTQTATELTNIATVTANDAHRVTVTLKQPNPAQRGAFAIISFVQQKAYGQAHGADLGTPAAPPVGTGPYRIGSFSTSGITLQRNPAYWSQPPSVDTFTFVTITDDNAGQLAMRSGELQGVPLLDVKTSPQWARVPGATTWSSPTLYLDYVTMDQSRAPFDDVHVRRAIAHATDVTGLLKANYGAEARPPLGLTPREVVSQVAPDAGALAATAAAAPSYPYDLDKARAEIAQSAHPNGFEATYEYYSPPGKLVGVSLQENLAKIGIKLTLKSRQLNDFIGDLFAGKVPQIGFFSISAVVPDPSSWYLYLVAAGNPYNAAHYSTAATRAALRQIDAGDRTARWQAVQSLVRQTATDVPYVGLAQPNYVFALAKGMTFTKTPDFIQMTSGNWVNLLKSTS